MPVVVRKDVSGNNVAEGRLTFKRLDFRLGDGRQGTGGAVAGDVAVRVRMVLPAVTA
jgi:hypothetical protein